MAIIFVIDGKEGEKIRLQNIPQLGETVNVKRATGTDIYTVSAIEHSINMAIRSGVSDVRIFLNKIKSIDTEEKIQEEKTGAV